MIAFTCNVILLSLVATQFIDGEFSFGESLFKSLLFSLQMILCFISGISRTLLIRYKDIVHIKQVHLSISVLLFSIFAYLYFMLGSSNSIISIFVFPTILGFCISRFTISLARFMRVTNQNNLLEHWR